MAVNSIRGRAVAGPDTEPNGRANADKIALARSSFYLGILHIETQAERFSEESPSHFSSSGKFQMETFEQAWERIALSRDHERVAEALRPLLRHTHQALTKQPPDFNEIKVALEGLLLFLALPPRRTNANCWAVDQFFAFEDWKVAWDIFPEPLTEIFGDIGGALHDTVSSPEVARNFNSLPEQLLGRIKQWKPE